VVDESDSGIDGPAKATSEARFGLARLLGASDRTLHFASLSGVDGVATSSAFTISTNADPPTLAEVDTVPMQRARNTPCEVGSIAENVQVFVRIHKIEPHIHIVETIEVAENVQANHEALRVNLSEECDLGLDLSLKVGTVLETVRKPHTIAEAFRPPHTGRRARCALFQGNRIHGHSAPLALDDDRLTLAELAVVSDRLDNLTLKRQLARLSVDRAGFRERRVTGLELHARDYRVSDCGRNG